MFDVGSELIVILDLTSCVQNQLNVLTNEKKKKEMETRAEKLLGF